MRKCFAVQMTLLVPALAGAAVLEIPVSTQSVGVLGYGESTIVRTLSKQGVSSPAAIRSRDLPRPGLRA